MKSTRILLTTAVALVLLSPQVFAQQDAVPPGEDNGGPPPAGNGNGPNPPLPRDDQGPRPGGPHPWRRGNNNNNNNSNFNGPRGAGRPQSGSKDGQQSNSSRDPDSAGRPHDMSGPYGGRPFRRTDSGQGQQSGLRGGGSDGGDDRRQQFKQKLVDRFDANHNGKLDPEELQGLRSFMEKRRQMREGGSGGTTRGGDNELAGAGGGFAKVRNFGSGPNTQYAATPNARLRIIQHNPSLSSVGNSTQHPPDAPASAAPKDSRLPDALQE